MKLVDLAFIINPNQRVRISIDYSDPLKDTKVIGPTEFYKIGFGGYEVIDMAASNNTILIRCKEIVGD